MHTLPLLGKYCVVLLNWCDELTHLSLLSAFDLTKRKYSPKITQLPNYWNSTKEHSEKKQNFEISFHEKQFCRSEVDKEKNGKWQFSICLSTKRQIVCHFFARSQKYSDTNLQGKPINNIEEKQRKITFKRSVKLWCVTFVERLLWSSDLNWKHQWLRSVHALVNFIWRDGLPNLILRFSTEDTGCRVKTQNLIHWLNLCPVQKRQEMRAKLPIFSCIKQQEHMTWAHYSIAHRPLRCNQFVHKFYDSRKQQRDYSALCSCANSFPLRVWTRRSNWPFCFHGCPTLSKFCPELIRNRLDSGIGLQALASANEPSKGPKPNTHPLKRNFSLLFLPPPKGCANSRNGWLSWIQLPNVDTKQIEQDIPNK